MQREYDLFLPWEGNRTQDIFTRVKEEFIFRLNPHWIIKTFSNSVESYTAEITDHETEKPFIVKGSCTRDTNGFPKLSADSEEWQSINFFEKNGSLHANVTYAEEPSEEIERKVVLWLRSVKEYLRLYTKNTLNTRFFRLLMDKVILQMTPSQRKISLMLIRITMLELLVILLIVVGWWFFS